MGKGKKNQSILSSTEEKVIIVGVMIQRTVSNSRQWQISCVPCCLSLRLVPELAARLFLGVSECHGIFWLFSQWMGGFWP